MARGTGRPYVRVRDWPPLPKKGTPERAALVAEIVRLVGEGMTHLAISNKLGVSSVPYLLAEAKRKEHDHG